MPTGGRHLLLTPRRVSPELNFCFGLWPPGLKKDGGWWLSPFFNAQKPFPRSPGIKCRCRPVGDPWASSFFNDRKPQPLKKDVARIRAGGSVDLLERGRPAGPGIQSILYHSLYILCNTLYDILYILCIIPYNILTNILYNNLLHPTIFYSTLRY